MTFLVQLPNNASTSKYPKTFPHPLNLSSRFVKGDVLFDIALECFRSNKEHVFATLDAWLKRIHSLDKDYDFVVNAGDFPPDAAYSEYYDYFFERLKRDVTAVGTYSVLFKDKIESKFEHVKVSTAQFHFPDYYQINYDKYPKVDGKKRASIRASWGCPRSCAMCPVPKYFDNRFFFYGVDSVARTIENLYEKGIRYFTFIDDNLSFSDEFVELLVKLRKLKLKGAKFHCQEGFDVDTFNLTRARLLKALDFDDVKLAFESIHEDSMKLINKRSVNRKSIERAIEAANTAGLKIKGFLLLGLDETEEMVMENLRFFAKHKINLRVNIARDYGWMSQTEFAKKRVLDDKALRHLKALAYASSFFVEQFDADLFNDSLDTILSKAGLERDDNTLRGKTNYGFQTSRLEKGLKFLWKRDIERNDKEKGEIVFRSDGLLDNVNDSNEIDDEQEIENDAQTRSDRREETIEVEDDKDIAQDDEIENSSDESAEETEELDGDKGFTAKALAKSRKLRSAFLSKFGVDGRVPASILIHDRKEYRYETIDLSAQRKGGNYVHWYRKNRQKMHERKDYTPGLEHSGFETQGRTAFISGFPQNVGRFITDIYCPAKGVVYDPFCVTGDTLISTIEGDAPIRDLVGKEPWVFCSDGKETKLRKASNIRKTRENAELVRIHLYNNDHLDLTPDHLVMTTSGEWVKARDLRSGQSLMPFYRQISHGRWVVKIKRIEFLSEKQDVYNMEVDEFHNFAANGVIVHNCGHNSRMQLVFKTGRSYIGVDCCEEFMADNEEVKKILYERRDAQLVVKHENSITLYLQSSENVPQVESESCDFTITSPPYWDIEKYGPEPEQLGIGKTYEQFLDGLERCAKENYRILKPGAFCAWFINDFRKDKKFYPYHMHTYDILLSVGFEGFNIYIVDLGASVGHMYVADIINHRLLAKRHEYCVLVRKPGGSDWWLEEELIDLTE